MTDTGVGMPAHVAAKAFEPFFTTKPVGTGTGVGLSQSRALCERSGGAVTLYSVEGKGTEVAFYLPRATAEPNPKIRQALPVVSAEQPVGRHILLVEDNAVVAEAERSLLQMLGHVVDWAADAHQALDRIARDDSYDLVLSDVQMPGGMTGIELAERLACEHPYLPVALVTGYVEEIQRLDALHIRVFTKPFDLAELEAYICSIPENQSNRLVTNA
jgi:CheY-like chemotaxis protein